MRPCANVFFDSMMLNLAASRSSVCVESLLEGGKVQCLLPYSVRDEASKPSCPPAVRAAVSRFLYTLDVGPLTQPEYDDVIAFFSAHIGEMKPKNITRDLFHVWEAAKYGGDFFITQDRRLLARADDIRRHKGIWVIAPEEAAALYAAMPDEDGSG